MKSSMRLVYIDSESQILKNVSFSALERVLFTRASLRWGSVHESVNLTLLDRFVVGIVYQARYLIVRIQEI
jgi:hypothetical protein